MSGSGWRRALAVAVAGLIVGGPLVAGCGIGPSQPQDVGDGLDAKGSRRVFVAPPQPNQFTSPEGLVGGFLKAAAGAGESGVAQAKAFLTEHAAEGWRVPSNPEDLTVIRTTVREGGQQGGRLEVVVTYQVVGVLGEQGRLSKLFDPLPQARSMKLWVKPDPLSETPLRIDELEGDIPSGLFLSDTALTDYYDVQPIYFWDSDGQRLVPDLRYVLKSLPDAARATWLVKALIAGPSAMLGAVQRLRFGTQAESVTLENGQLVVKLNPGAIPPDRAAAAKRLLYQLQWSLSTIDGTPAIKLQIGDETWQSDVTDFSYKGFNEATHLPSSPRTFDLKDGKVVAVAEGGGEPPRVPVLGSKENRNVESAAMSRDGDALALVVGGVLHIVREGAKSPPARLQSPNMGRPAWVAGTDRVLVPAGGKIMSVSAEDGRYTDITPHGAGYVTSVSVSPDARRIAYVADEAVQVAQLGVTGGVLTVEPEPQLLRVSANLLATGVAWAGEAWLKVVGQEGNVSVMYDLTADGVVAERIELKGVDPVGVVAYPLGGQNADVYVLTNGAAYIKGLSESELHAPFFAQ